MKKVFAGLYLGLGLIACNRDAGECPPEPDKAAGAGAGTSTPAGAQGSGDVPPGSRNAAAPSDPSRPQTAECTVTWKSCSDFCKQKGTSASCTTLYQGAHATLTEAKDRCELAHGVKGSSEVQSCGPCQWVTSEQSSP